MATRTFDAVVIGAGPGGYVAAIRLAQLGKRVALVERESLGGVCLNWGCIPSKALIAAASLVDEIREAAGRGILVEAPRIDLARLREFKSAVVRKLVGGVGQLEKGNGVEVIAGTARFTSATGIEVAGGAEPLRLEAPAFILATGARSIEIPGFAFGGGAVWSAREAVDLPSLPGRLLVVGGGVIGVELGTVYAKLGAAVTIVEALPGILAGVDPEAVRLVQRGLRQRGATIHAGARALGFERRGEALAVRIEVGGVAQEIEVDQILVAVGMRPSTEGLGLEAAGVRVGPRGFVEVDGQGRTSAPSIFAIGDVAGPPLLAHKASKEGEIAAEAIAGRRSTRDWAAIPAAIFSDPEVASVGLGEEEARREGRQPLVGKFSFGALGRAIAMDRAEGFVKVIGDRETGRLLGATFCGPEASDLVAEATLALEMGATLEDVALTVHAHPTLPEAFMEACKAALGEAIHAINRPARPPAGGRTDRPA